MRARLPGVLPLVLAGCAAPHAFLLPGEAGHPVGALAVLNPDGSEKVLDQPYLSARMAKSHTSVHRTAAKPAFDELMAFIPPPPKTFTLYFYPDTTVLTPQSVPVLGQILGEFLSRPGAEAQVTGFTDTVGSEDYNDQLSLMRATQVMNWLATQGFPKDALRAVGRGERDLAVPTADEVPNELNRRVEVIVR